MSANDIQYVRWDPSSGSSPNRNNNNNTNEFSMLTPRSGAEAMARLAAQAQEEQRLHEQGMLPSRPINETTNNRPAARTSNNNSTSQPRSSPAPSANKKSVSPAPSNNRTNNTNKKNYQNNSNDSRNTNTSGEHPHHNHYHLNLDSQQRSHPVTPVQVLLQVQESLEHAVQTADTHDAPELSGPEPQADYVPVEGSVGIPKFRTFLEQEEYKAQQNANQRAMSSVSASIPRSFAGGGHGSVAPHHLGATGHPGYAPSEIIPDDSVSRIHGMPGGNHMMMDGDQHSDVHSMNDNDDQHPSGGRMTPRGGNNNNKSSPYRDGHRPLTPRSTVYVTNAVTARFVSERFEASVRDSLIQQEYEHRMDLMRYFYQQTSGIQQREAKSQLREALEQQYLARAEVEELRGAIALRLSDIEEVSRLRLEQIANDTRVNLEREINRLYGIVAAGQNAAQQQWLLGCEERERHFISSESDRVWSRIAGNYLSEGHSLQLKSMLKDRIPVAHSRVVNDALESVQEAPQAITPLHNLPAQTASPQMYVGASSQQRQQNQQDGGDELPVHQQPIQIRSLRNQQSSLRAARPKTPPSSYGGTPRDEQQQQGEDDEVAAVNADALILPKRSPKRTTVGTPRGGKRTQQQQESKQQQQQQALPSQQQQQNKGGAVEITEVDGPADSSFNNNNNKNRRINNNTPPTSARSGSGRVGAAGRKPQQGGGSLLDEPAPVPNTPRPAGAPDSGPTETLADRRKKARLEKKQQMEAARDEKKRQQLEQAEMRRQEIEERQQQARANSRPRGGGRSHDSTSSLIDRPLPNVFPEYWGWMFRSLGALHTWQRRLFILTSNGRLRCSSSEKGPWVLVTTADKILRVEVDSYHDVSGHGLAPPTTQYHQFGFYLDVIDGDANGDAQQHHHSASTHNQNIRQKRLRFCCFSRADLTNWMHILRRATETVGQLAELGVPGAISPLRRRYEDLAEEADRLGAPVAAAATATAASQSQSQSRRHRSPIGGPHHQVAADDESSEKLNEWLSQHQDADGNPLTAPPVIPYRARVQLEDEIAVLEAREQREYEKQRRAESEHRDPSLKHPLAHYNTLTALGKPRAPHELEQYN